MFTICVASGMISGSLRAATLQKTPRSGTAGNPQRLQVPSIHREAGWTHGLFYHKGCFSKQRFGLWVKQDSIDVDHSCIQLSNRSHGRWGVAGLQGGLEQIWVSWSKSVTNPAAHCGSTLWQHTVAAHCAPQNTKPDITKSACWCGKLLLYITGGEPGMRIDSETWSAVHQQQIVFYHLLGKLWEFKQPAICCHRKKHEQTLDSRTNTRPAFHQRNTKFSKDFQLVLWRKAAQWKPCDLWVSSRLVSSHCLQQIGPCARWNRSRLRRLSRVSSCSGPCSSCRGGKGSDSVADSIYICSLFLLLLLL